MLKSYAEGSDLEIFAGDRDKGASGVAHVGVELGGEFKPGCGIVFAVAG